MIYVFEDKRDDILSELFQKGYSDKVKNQFVYANGNGALVKTVKNILEKTDEIISVYMDAIPGNRSIVDIYCDLKRLAEKYEGRVRLFPIVCSEYYFIQSIYQTELIEHCEDVDICVNRDIYWQSELANASDQNRKFCKNFEKYCKLILMACTKACVSHSAANNEKYGVYYTKDCLCKYAENWCFACGVEKKAENLLEQYPCVPDKDDINQSEGMTDDMAYKIHVRLVQAFNEMCDRYAEKDAVTRYKKIRVMKKGGNMYEMESQGESLQSKNAQNDG